MFACPIHGVTDGWTCPQCDFERKRTTEIKTLRARVEAAKAQLEAYRLDMPSEAFKALGEALGE